ncbi:MAG: c-type cytochrome domain-containing protein, partial [Verrucomicrobiota bacterium]
MAGLARIIASSGCSTAGAEDFEFFEKQIRPVLVERCYKCHSSESKKAKGGLLLDTREGLLQGGDHGPAIVPPEVKIPSKAPL